MFVISKWREKFENSDTRKRQRLGWFLAPSGTDSRGYRKLMRAGSDGIMALGVFTGLCQYMATLPKETRGAFVNSDGSAMDIEDISEITRMEVADIRHATGTLVECGWISLISADCVPPICHQSASSLPVGEEVSQVVDLSIECQSSASSLPPICHQSPAFVKGEGEGEGEDIIMPSAKKVSDLDNLKKRIGKLVKRRESTQWSEKEMKALKKLKPTIEDIEFLESKNYANHEFRRRDVITLLNNWAGELDRMNALELGAAAQQPAGRSYRV